MSHSPSPALPRPTGHAPSAAPSAAPRVPLARAAAWGVVLAVVLAAALSLTARPAAAQSTILDDAKDQFKALTGLWPFTLSYVARRLFVSLALLEFSITAAGWVLGAKSLEEIARGFLLKFILLSFVLGLITSSDYWLSPIVSSFVRAGSIIGPVRAPPGPSEILDMGFKYNYFDTGFSAIPVNPLAAMFAAFWMVVAQLGILVACAAAAVQLLLLWVETYVSLNAGVLFLGFGGFRGTAAYAENYLNHVFYLGIRLFVFYCMLSLCYQIIISNNGFVLKGAPAPWSGGAPTVTVTGALGAAVMAGVFALLVIKVPASIAGRIAGGGGQHFGISAALRSL